MTGFKMQAVSGLERVNKLGTWKGTWWREVRDKKAHKVIKGGEVDFRKGGAMGAAGIIGGGGRGGGLGGGGVSQ